MVKLTHNIGYSIAKIEADLIPDIPEVDSIKVSYLFDELGLLSVYTKTTVLENKTRFKNGVSYELIKNIVLKEEI